MITTVLAILKPLLIKGANVAWEHRNQLSLYFKTKFWKYRNSDIRFSISGLYKIQIPDTNEYLLVLNRRIQNQLQPVGGAYKRFGDDSLFNKWGYKPDNSKNGLDVDEKSSSDLRFMVKGKYCVEVLNWFDTGNERESDPKREFFEELVSTKILDPEIFCNIQHKRIRRFSKNLIWSEFFSCYEILIFDVFEFIPNEEQRKALVELSMHKTDLSRGFAIVKCDDIEQLRLVENGRQIARIGQHTKLIINKNF
ncbi:SMODS-associated NUDIX domain-containing protein [Chryseobacterium taklimakanense]|uniref:CD-NTase-associated protein 16 NUDIX domain-containing protein n=1 Tax=Chryseobacterium taklimakanense TaxID=536441 RepID=A0A3G8WW72_9FLAO|nr:hypothetical protein [Chryseobacterium taklimakanense]AZI20601.1 hypothetical protein EIH08_07630 [Chryseobacterium taklimakanense]